MKWNVQKLSASLSAKGEVEYKDPSSEGLLNDRIGQRLKLEFKGEINCIACDRKIKKTFAQGYCFPCMQSLASCDQCIVRPELCHHHKGTCREPEWGTKNCMIPHTVYLSLTSGVKIGVRLAHQKTTRWIDQGATAAVEVGKTEKRLHAGLIESAMKSVFADKTNWRAMLKGSADEESKENNLEQNVDSFWEELDKTEFAELIEESPIEIKKLRYPVASYPEKIKSLGFDKSPLIEGTLHGVKGQYLYIDDFVVNVRKHQGYEIGWSWEK